MDDAGILKKGTKRFIWDNNLKNNSTDRVAIILGEKCLIERTLLKLNEKDINAIVLEVVLFGKYEKMGYGIRKIFSGAMKNNMIQKDDIKKLYRLSKEIDGKDRDKIPKAPVADAPNMRLPKIKLSR